VTDRYVPDRGDVVWLNFDPQSGREQAGHRPALVLSPAAYNSRIGLMVVCPITSRLKGYPFEVPLLGDPDIAGAVLADHVKSVDWKARRARKKGKASSAVVRQVLGKLQALIGIS
jgi:mRNA interferase MazF